MNTESGSGHPEPTVRGNDASMLAVAVCVGLALMAALAPPSAAATTTWRCGNAYADTPCPGGRRIDLPATPDASARHASDEATRHIERRADAMERDRLRAEQAAARNGAVILPDHRVAEAQAREAARIAARRADRDTQQRGIGGLSGRHGRRHPAVEGFVAQGGGRRR